jgi:hypothetical protein
MELGHFSFIQEGRIPCPSYRPWSVSAGCRQAMGHTKMIKNQAMRLGLYTGERDTLSVIAGAGGEYGKHG